MTVGVKDLPRSIEQVTEAGQRVKKVAESVSNAKKTKDAYDAYNKDKGADMDTIPVFDPWGNASRYVITENDIAIDTISAFER
ncbi:MAG: hypothetical protein WBB45_03850 [Cyclobacteriaceae bacterium]